MPHGYLGSFSCQGRWVELQMSIELSSFRLIHEERADTSCHKLTLQTMEVEELVPRLSQLSSFTNTVFLDPHTVPQS